MSHKRCDRKAMTLVEVVVALLVLAILAAVIYPTAAGQLRRGQSAALANQLDNLRQAIANFQKNVLRFPSTLTQLTTSALAGNDICGTAIPAGNVALYRGPYLNQNITGNMPVGDATVQNALVRNPAGSFIGQPGILQVNVVTVDSLAAAELEQQFDGTPFNYGTGTILWTATTGQLGNLTFQIPIRGC